MINFYHKANKSGYAIDIQDDGKKWDHGLWEGEVQNGKWKTMMPSNKCVEDCI